MISCYRPGGKLAPAPGLEPGTLGLTVRRSAFELGRNSITRCFGSDLSTGVGWIPTQASRSPSERKFWRASMTKKAGQLMPRTNARAPGTPPMASEVATKAPMPVYSASTRSRADFSRAPAWRGPWPHRGSRSPGACRHGPRPHAGELAPPSSAGPRRCDANASGTRRAPGSRSRARSRWSWSPSRCS
jgi:hypothetical protein